MERVSGGGAAVRGELEAGRARRKIEGPPPPALQSRRALLGVGLPPLGAMSRSSPHSHQPSHDFGL